MSQAYSGVAANVVVGTTDMDAEAWSADVDVNTFDSSTTADGGWEDMSPSTKKVTGSFDFFYNPSKKPTGGSVGLTPGSIVNTLTLYIDKTDDSGDTLSGKALITKLSLKTKVKDGFKVTASFMSKGPWTLPS